MKENKFCFLALVITICLFIFLSGCSNFKIESYSLKTLSQRKITVEGPIRENAMDFQGGQTTDIVEIVFDSLVQSINAKGNAIEKITIKELKYVAEVRSEIVLDFDSSKDKNPNNALAALIGQSYIIEVTPEGRVAKIVDINDARDAIREIPSNYEITKGLLSDETIEMRHSVPLPDANDYELKADKTWTRIKSFDFDQMGSASFERSYKVEKIEKAGGKLIAIITMSAIPAAGGTVPPMTDVRQTYTGSMELDITAGTLLKYEEKLVNEWFIVPSGTGRDGPPNVFKMTATKSYDIEKIK